MFPFPRPRLFFFVTLLLFLLPPAVRAQQQKADSLKAVLAKTTDDTSRIFLHNEIGLAFIDVSPDSALQWWAKGCRLAAAQKPKHTGAVLRRILFYEGEMLGNSGFVYANRGMAAAALDYNFNCLRLRESIGDEHGIAESFNNLAFVYKQQHDTLKALEYYTKSAAKYAAIKDTGGVTYTQINRAQIYTGQGKDSLALEMYTRAMHTLSGKPQHHRGYSSCLASIGMIYMRMNRFEDALLFLRRSVAVRQAHNDQLSTAASYVAIGKLYMKQGMTDSALYYAEKGHALAGETKNAQALIASAQLLSGIYKARGDYGRALDFYDEYITARDIVNSEETGKQMVRQQMGYEYAKKSAADSILFLQEKEVDQLKLSRQRGYTIGGFSALAVVAALLFFVYRQRNGIAREKKRSDELLLNILPAETAEELKTTGAAKTKSYSSVTVMFTDFKNFTQTAELLSATELVALINSCYGEFDRIVSKHNVEKIKTIGDSYMCAGGLPVANETHAVDTVYAALEMLEFIHAFNDERRKNQQPFFDIRIGLHTGAVVAGIVGTKKFAYDIWGDTVNIASRMESSGAPGRINISESTYALVKDKFDCEYRGKVKAKNKGEIDMYFIINAEKATDSAFAEASTYSPA